MWMFQRRYAMMLLASMGIMWFFTQRLNLSVAIVAMVKSTGDNVTMSITECPGQEIDKTQIYKEGEFDWDLELQGSILGSFFYGYSVATLFGGFLAQRFGGRRVFATGLFFTSLLAILTPAAARISPDLLIFTRVIQGCFGGLLFTPLPALTDEFIPESEKTRFMAFVMSGSNLGVVVAQVLTGILSASEFLGGWPAAFYAMGIGGMVCVAAWVIVVRPKDLSKMADREALLGKHENKVKMRDVPWKKILTSYPVWATTFCQTCLFWGEATLMAFLPTYMRQILNFDIEENGLLSSLPYIVCWLFSNIGGVISDWLIEKQICSTHAVRKIMTCGAGFSMAMFFVAAGYTGCDVTSNVILISLALGVYGLCICGVYVSPLDLSPKYSSTIFGLVGSIACSAGFLGPLVVGLILQNEPTQARWRLVFWHLAVICCLGAVCFLFFGSGHVQPWSLEVVIEDPSTENALKQGDTGPEYKVKDKNKRQYGTASLNLS